VRKRFHFHYLRDNLLWLVLILFSIGALYVNGLDIRYASRDDLSISSVFQHNVFHQAATAAKAEGRFYFYFIVPISSAILQIQSNVLFDAIRLLPYFVGLVGFAYFLNGVCAQRMPFLPTLAICLVFTPIWPAYTPILGFPWCFSLGFCAFCLGSLRVA
jgi:hypothetical protein